MSVNFHYDCANKICEMHIRGILKRADMSPGEADLAARIDAGERPRLLVLLEDFDGWQQGDDWSNMDFMFSYGDEIAKIAIVGAGDKEAEAKAFTGAGLRPTPVRFFSAGETEAARIWLLE